MDVVAIDIETTGFGKKAKILEIGAVHGSKTMSVIIRREVPKHIIKLTGITQKEANLGTTEEEAIKLFQAFVKGARLMVGHNIIRFDMPFLLRAGFVLKMPLYDTMVEEKKATKESASLVATCKRHGIKNETAHRATSDAKAAYNIFLKQKKRQKWK